MVRNILFSKVSLDSKEAYELAEDYSKRYQITNNIISMLHNDYSFHDEHEFIDDNGELKTEVVDYTLSIEYKDDSSIHGTLYRKGILYIKELDKTAREMKTKGVENTEDIEFYYDVLHEYVAFYIRKRFGKNMFNDALCKILNQSSKEANLNYSFYVETFNLGMTIEEIQEAIRIEKDIKQLTITYHPANPDETIIDKIKSSQENEKLKETNATERTVIYKAKGDIHINGGAELIQDDLRNLVNINPELSMQDLTQRGYVVIICENQKGDVKSTVDNKPFIKKFDEAAIDFLTAAKNGIIELLRKV